MVGSLPSVVLLNVAGFLSRFSFDLDPCLDLDLLRRDLDLLKNASIKQILRAINYHSVVVFRINCCSIVKRLSTVTAKGQNS